MNVDLRATSDRDRDQVLRVVRDAFTKGANDGHEEVDIVVETWRRGAAPVDLDLVAVGGDDRVVGHVMASRGDLGGRAVLGIAPVSVAPAHQGAGIGSLMMREIIERANALREPMLVLLGSPAYYGRFGFEPAGRHGVHYLPVGVDSAYFQLRRLDAYDPAVQGSYVYCWELPLTLP